MLRAMCGAKLMEKKRTEDLRMEMLGLKETVVQMAKANGDRKSVVQGKSVDLGGRRIIKKKKKNQFIDISHFTEQ